MAGRRHPPDPPSSPAAASLLSNALPVRWWRTLDLRVLASSPESGPFVAQGILPQLLYAPGPQKQEQWFPAGATLVATPLGDVSLVSRHKWGLTTSLVPSAWLIEVDQTRGRHHGEEENLGEVDIRRGDSFLIIWEEEGWTLFERYAGDIAAWTVTAIPPGQEMAPHNHLRRGRSPRASSDTKHHRPNPPATAPGTEAKEHASPWEARGHSHPMPADKPPHKPFRV